MSALSMETHHNCLICLQLGSNGASVFSEQELEMHTIEEWKKEKQALFPSSIHSLAYVSSLLMASLKHVCYTINCIEELMLFRA